MGDERTVAFDLVVQIVQARAVSLRAEPGHDPDHEPQEVDDRTDVIERHAQARGAQVVDAQARGFSQRAVPLGIAATGVALWSHQVLAQLRNTARPDLL